MIGDEEIIKEYCKKNNFDLLNSKNIDLSKNRNIFFDVKCLKCGKVTNKNFYTLVILDSKCNHCIDRSTYQMKTKENALQKINEKCNELGFLFIDFDGGKWLGCRKTKLIIKCLKCSNISIKNYDNFINKDSGCLYCRNIKAAKSTRLSNEEVLNRIKDLCVKYDFTFIGFKNKNNEYYNNRTKLILKCNKCGELVYPLCNKFFNDVVYICKECTIISKGELIIKELLIKYNLHFEQQKTFKWLKNKNSLRLDFYLPDYKTAIEYQGIQHFKEIEYFGGKEGLKESIKRDDIKYNLCKENNINIFYINYNDNIEEKIDCFVKNISN